MFLLRAKLKQHPLFSMRGIIDLKVTSAICLWAVIVTSGFSKLLVYEMTPGELGKPPSYWLRESGLPTQPTLNTLVMVVHPHCGCSRASLGELAIIMGKFQDKVNADVLFYAPSDLDQNWTETDLWETAQSIPGVHAIVDKDGGVAKLFNAMTSGETLLYNASGQLVFWGGITSSRGHSGDNVGRDTITALLRGEKPDLQETSVFGCHLFKPRSQAGKEI